VGVRGFIGRRQSFGVPESLYDYPVPVSAGCLVALLLIFVGDATTPPTIVLTPLYVVPAAAAAALLPSRSALCVCSGAIALQTAGQLMQRSTVDSMLAGIGTLMLVFVLVRLLSVSRAAAKGRRLAVAHRLTSEEPGYGSLNGKLQLLTKREREVSDLVVEGRSAREIARLLHIGRRTVETHKARAYAKLGVTSRVDLILKTAATRGQFSGRYRVTEEIS
jgi:DNA-binding CsgD family transcriptional regulator